MSLHTLTLCVKRFMQRIDEEVADAAESHVRTRFGGNTFNDHDRHRGGHSSDASAAPPVHGTLLGA